MDEREFSDRRENLGLIAKVRKEASRLVRKILIDQRWSDIRRMLNAALDKEPDEHGRNVKLLARYKGFGGRIWEKDPQEYVSALRAEERSR